MKKKRQWPKRNREQQRNHSLNAALKQRGLTREQYDRLLHDQGHVCAICERAPKGRALAIDHDHKFGHTRGLLCTRCNMGLGMFGDSRKLLVAAAQYVFMWDDHAKLVF